MSFLALMMTLDRPVAFKSGSNPFPKTTEGKFELSSVDYTETYAVSERRNSLYTIVSGV